jgi:MoaA/NifB/PqqE/SkfB family radical SAM enzyme
MSGDHIKIHDLDKDHLLKESKVFCMFPWTHLNATPKGDIYPCCSNDYTDPMGNTHDMTLAEAFNTDYMKQLRLNMLNGVESKICTFCYNHEKSSPHSFRTYSLDNFKQHFDEVMSMTRTDGTVDELRMRYFDIRFSNICNFKCRTCGTEFSSQWAMEDKKTYNPDGPIIIHVDDQKGNVLEEVLDQVDYIDLAYFAGGEPLITQEHYVILEELIRKGRTDTVLRYNTNASTLNYKQYDIIELWKHFKKVEVSCSIDHYGERAELIRHGTNWEKIKHNLVVFRGLEFVDFQINTVLSVFNYMTLVDLYDYMIENQIIDPDKDWYHSLYQAVHPRHYSARALPAEMKKIAREKIEKRFTGNGCLDRLAHEAMNFAEQEDLWEETRDAFFHNTVRIDGIRNEDLFRVFPELSPLEFDF